MIRVKPERAKGPGMQHNISEREYPVLAPGRMTGRGVLWLVWGLGLTCLLLAGSAVGLGKITLPSHRQFSGELRPDRDPVALQLPAGAYLSRILVERGEMIRAGQTLATLDVAAMEARLAELERSIAADRLLRACLLGEETRIAPRPARDSELQALLRSAQVDCEARQEARAASEARIAAGRLILTERRDLLEDYLTVSALGAADAPPDPKAVRRLLALAISRNLTDQSIAELNGRADSDRIAARRNTLEEVRGLSGRIAAALRQRAVLTRLLEAPRLLAPESGRINRVRPVQAGLSLDDPVDILEIVPGDSRAFIARFPAPDGMAGALPVGTPVRIRLMGAWDSAPPFTGRIDGISGDRGRGAMVEVRLSDDSIRHLSDPEDGIALRGAGTASAIQVRMADYRVDRLLAESLRGAAPGLSRWFDALAGKLSPAASASPGGAETEAVPGKGAAGGAPRR